MSRKLILAALAGGLSLLSLAGAPMASASIVITNVQVPYYEGITLTATGSSPAGLFGGIGHSEAIGIAGQIDLTTNIGILGTWCVDLFRDITLGGSYTYTVGTLTTDNRIPIPDALTPAQINRIGALAAYGNFLMSTTPTNRNSAVVQAAIWNVEYGTTATNSTDAGFAALLASVQGMSLTNPGGNQLFSSQDSQGVYLNQGLYHPNNVPEPASLALFALGLLSLLGLQMTRRKKT